MPWHAVQKRKKETCLGKPALDPNELLEVPTSQGGVRLMRASEVASTSLEEFNEMRQV